tara:strand:+ start:1850 stop:2071 length:222 start_codon:yes stop_codon:yes gene_type:complete
VYHGGGGFKHEEVYNMPTWMRRFHLEKIAEFIKKQNKAREEAQNSNKQSLSNSPMGPNIKSTKKPSSIYNIKK